ncbi:CPBP family intramembrane metalloprotease [Ktedonosporobacter rubrisoli]|uniref:CPBP family intramembrane metalloprotease n=1 Tax=Ktedonosporobacter rubrisoli TaxID=2509675 RepID=A0A4P6K513_KTERU|nr:CPBP family intramembrane glutamic endopeptidase [Ktedonosporobacter rubrisoli]QBD83062.1 CPBP family intramembrane metalloprotease [Ktedonosporobacter rubrisoli]
MLGQKFEKVPWTIQQTFLGILFTLVPWIVLALLLSSFKGQSTHIARLPFQVDLLNAFVIFFFSVLVEAAFLIAPLYFARRAVHAQEEPHQSVADVLGLRAFNPRKALPAIILLFLAFLAINGVYQYVITVFHLNLQTNDQAIFDQSRVAPITTYATLIASVVAAPFCEEMFFRSFVFMGFRRGMPLVGAIILSSLVFAVAHADPGSFVVLFFIGLALAFLRWYTRSLWPGIILHLLNNGVGAILIILAMQGIMRP